MGNNDQQSSHHRRSSSTHSLPALGRRLSSGSLKAVKWIGKKFKSKKSPTASSSDSEEIWGTSRERPAEASDDDEPPPTPARPARPSQPQGSVPRSTLEHRARRRALENHWDEIYSYDSHPAPLIPKPVSLERRAPPPRPLTSQVRGRARLLSQNSNPPPTPPSHYPSHASRDYLPPRSPHRAVRLQSLERREYVSALPRPGPPPFRPLPHLPKPTSLYPIPPPIRPLRISQRKQLYDEESVYSNNSS